MPRPRSRRTVLALSASALLSLAGCTSGGRRKTDDRTTRAVCTDESAIETTTTTETATTDPTRNATEESNEGHEHYRYVQIIVQGVTPVHVANEIVQQFSDLSELQQQVVSETVANGAYVLSEEGRSVEPFESVAFVAYDGDYYRVEAAPRTPTVGYNSRYTAERVARSESELREVLAREAVLRPLARDLSSDVAQLLASLIPGPSRREWNDPIPDRVDALLAYFREENPTGLRNRHFLAYCGEYYRADVTVAEA